MRRSSSVVSFVLLAAACGGKSKPVEVKAPEPVVEAKPPPPPPPVCVPATEPAQVKVATADGAAAQFCLSDGSADACFAVDIAKSKYAKLAEPPTAQLPSLEAGAARVETTATEVRVCVDIAEGEASCTTLKPKVARGATEPIQAAVNATGTTVVALVGNAEAGKGTAEVWDVAKKKKTATIKYAKGDYKCGAVAMLGDTIFLSASVCAGPAARGGLYTLKGKKLADAGGKDFGTYGTVPIQLDGPSWAFLEEGAGAIAVQDVTTGTIGKTIDLVALWAGSSADDAPRANGNPGESALVRGPEGKVVVVTGSPVAGNVGVVDLPTGDVQVIKAIACKADAAEEPVVEPDAEPEPSVVEGE